MIISAFLGTLPYYLSFQMYGYKTVYNSILYIMFCYHKDYRAATFVKIHDIGNLHLLLKFLDQYHQEFTNVVSLFN